MKAIESNENQENEDKNGKVEKVEENGTEKQEKRSINKLVKKANAAKNISLLGQVPQKGNTFNMELAKALGILGFQNTRWMETSKHTGVTPKQILDQAHFSKTISIHKQRVNINLLFWGKIKICFTFQVKEEKELEENGGKPKEVVYGKVSKKLSFDDQTRQLHEAYQFLIKRYKLQEDIGHYAERVQALEKQQKRLEKMAIKAENNKNEEMENSEEVELQQLEKKSLKNLAKKAANKNKKADDADKQESKRKRSSSLKRTKKTPKNE